MRPTRQAFWAARSANDFMLCPGTAGSGSRVTGAQLQQTRPIDRRVELLLSVRSAEFPKGAAINSGTLPRRGRIGHADEQKTFSKPVFAVTCDLIATRGTCVAFRGVHLVKTATFHTSRCSCQNGVRPAGLDLKGGPSAPRHQPTWNPPLVQFS
jgi:hypothetical protein